MKIENLPLLVQLRQLSSPLGSLLCVADTDGRLHNLALTSAVNSLGPHEKQRLFCCKLQACLHCSTVQSLNSWHHFSSRKRCKVFVKGFFAGRHGFNSAERVVALFSHSVDIQLIQLADVKVLLKGVVNVTHFRINMRSSCHSDKR